MVSVAGQVLRENVMRTGQMKNAGNSRLRFFFDDAVASVSLSAHATVGDIALAFASYQSTGCGGAATSPIAFS